MPNNPFRPALVWKRSWPDERQKGTGNDPHNPKCQLRVYREFVSGGGGEETWHWVANERRFIEQGYAPTALEAIEKAEEAYFGFMSKERHG
ncbi:hypothetical protein PsAD2_02992 [Pseudovibrio axinellae]|uniref:Uncharacterized protein n=1 Tax=Pseudovibrio axinellae TaxID=989403 RepID=A0A165XFF2_9HYPH|nr:hypothetical protein [Pseudovibrio axinellae]KZL17656.1 hypothetical protein PsAD2_02992 [Pseudovibrio axinellae]SER44762.1 hypothetical protein SAMN05421798_11090 [Pseudovibrio axinellae]